MLSGHVVIYDDKLWVYAGCMVAPAAYTDGPSHSNYELAPLDAPTTRRYVQDPRPGSIRMLPGCPACSAAVGWRCAEDCPLGNDGRTGRLADAGIWSGLTEDQQFILARLVTNPDAEQWGGDVEVLRGLVAMGLVDKTDDAHVVTSRGREIYEAGR